ncbi:MAG: transcription antitermination factor NusB [Polyangiales bacterium]
MSPLAVAKNARTVAFEVLFRVEKDDAWASTTLDHAIEEAELDERDARLATHIVYGTLRVRSALDEKLNPLFKRRPDPIALAVLRASLFQLQHLSKLPTHAIVDEAVRYVRTRRSQPVASFVNAVLRKLAAERPSQPELPSALVPSKWLEKRLIASLGEMQTREFLTINAAAPRLHLRLRNPMDAESLGNQIVTAQPNAIVEQSPYFDSILYVSNAGDPRRLPGYNDGKFAVQDEGSFWITQTLDLKPGQSVLDLCAGRGGKTIVLAQAVGSSGRVVASDIHPHRVAQIEAERQRLQIDTPIETLARDMSKPPNGFVEQFDHVLVDAPCSGVGTLHRRPEIMARIDPNRLQELVALQILLLRNAAVLLKPGGRLTYAVCSPLAEEAESHKNLHLEKCELDHATQPLETTNDLSNNPVARWAPWTHSRPQASDAYQLMRWVYVG